MFHPEYTAKGIIKLSYLKQLPEPENSKSQLNSNECKKQVKSILGVSFGFGSLLRYLFTYQTTYSYQMA